jgi:hypothetical protein
MSIINAGPMAVYHADENGENAVVMPPTQGGITLNFNFETLDTLADITGNFARDMYYVGGAANFTVNYTEMTFDEVLALFPKTTGNAVELPVGCNARDDVISVILRPIICGEVSSDDTLAIFAPVVLPKPNFSTEFSLANQRIWTVEYTILPQDPRNHDFSMLYFGQVGT